MLPRILRLLSTDEIENMVPTATSVGGDLRTTYQKESRREQKTWNQKE